MSSLRLNRPSVPQRHQHSIVDASHSLSAANIGRSVARIRLPHQSAVLSNMARRAGARQIRCQASPYSLDPSMPSLEYQPLELPASAVKTYDFLVLGSGIAGLTYALKVCRCCCLTSYVYTAYAHLMCIRSCDFPSVICAAVALASCLLFQWSLPARR